MSGVDAYYVLASGCKNHQSTSVSHFCVDGMAEYLEFAFLYYVDPSSLGSSSMATRPHRSQVVAMEVLDARVEEVLGNTTAGATKQFSAKWFLLKMAKRVPPARVEDDKQAGG
ncbi:hypothetical protein PPTG_23913 [Phytophthora nicotianae INRA-310]|uniref:Uncharacterized protein n=1 Tax=Phytophthora nicotianae (strain INRA-310) TaxID=761204 RepID=W2PP52_PHYN3|nr:hypothetical protein PPTG_23913 [Phytophthora nicotianae INRA-310]ETN02662.1 hypothetical protein PPTG_23913 [Phytophthora nicotianae INRA-310]